MIAGSDAALEREASNAPSRGRRLGRAVAFAVAAALALYTLVSQILAIVPSEWLGWALRVLPVQMGIVMIGTVRDVLGVYNVLIALVGLVLAVVAFRAWPRKRGPATAVAGASAVGLVCAAVTTTVLATTVHGYGGSPFLPTIPLAGERGAPDETVTFGSPDGVDLGADLYFPADDVPGPHPVVVAIHGGGFSAGSKGPNAYNRFLADNGYAVVDIDYRLATSDFHNWDAQVGDVGCAFTWLTANAGEYGFDVDRVATFGASSGGNLAVNAAYMAAEGTVKPTCGDARDLPVVRAVAAAYPAVDLVALQEDSKYGEQIGDLYVGGPPQEFPERYRAAGSMEHIGEQSPPTLIWQGSRDHIVFPGPVQEFTDELTRRGVPNEFVELPGMEHGTGDSSAAVTYGTAAARAQMLAWFDEHLG